MKNFQAGITLIEIMVIISVIAILSGIVVSDFPKIKLQLSLSRASHILVRDLKLAQDLSGSGTQITILENEIVTPVGFGVYVDNESLGNKKYYVYADINGDKQYQAIDYIYKEIDFEQLEPGIIIKEIRGASSKLDINFTSPNFSTTISNLLPGNEVVEIVLIIEKYPNIYRSIYVNKAGLIQSK